MKSIWKGVIAFGLVNVPVKLYKAAEEKALRFNQLHDSCNSRIKYRRVCPACEVEVSLDDIVRGYEYDKDRYVVFSDAELERGLAPMRAISILRFVDEDEIDPVCFDTAYYLGPDQVGTKAYALLCEAMRRTGRAAVATFALRERERPVLLRLRDGVIVLEAMFWPDEVREPALDHLDVAPELRPQEIEMACSLVESLAGTFDPTQVRDQYRERLQALVAAKIEGKPLEEPPAEKAADVIDLIEALQASVEAAAAAKVTTETAS